MNKEIKVGQIWKWDNTFRDIVEVVNVDFQMVYYKYIDGDEDDICNYEIEFFLDGLTLVKDVNEYTWTSKFNIGDKVVDEFDEIFYYIVSEVIHGVGGNVFYRFRNSFRTIHEDDLTLYEEPKKVTIELTQEQLDNIKSQGLI